MYIYIYNKERERERYAHIYIYICICVSIFTCTCTYAYICIYMYIYIYIFLCVDVWQFPWCFFARVHPLLALLSCTDALCYFQMISQMYNRFKEFLMMFMVLHVFTTYSIRKRRLRPNPRQQNNITRISMICKVFGRSAIGEGRLQPISSAADTNKYDVS